MEGARGWVRDLGSIGLCQLPAVWPPASQCVSLNLQRLLEITPKWLTLTRTRVSSRAAAHRLPPPPPAPRSVFTGSQTPGPPVSPGEAALLQQSAMSHPATPHPTHSRRRLRGPWSPLMGSSCHPAGRGPVWLVLSVPLLCVILPDLPASRSKCQGREGGRKGGWALGVFCPLPPIFHQGPLHYSSQKCFPENSQEQWEMPARLRRRCKYLGKRFAGRTLHVQRA